MADFLATVLVSTKALRGTADVIYDVGATRDDMGSLIVKNFKNRPRLQKAWQVLLDCFNNLLHLA